VRQHDFFESWRALPAFIESPAKPLKERRG